ncbi:MAG: HupE/UreJ family protein [Pseudomonadota bacterium]
MFGQLALAVLVSTVLVVAGHRAQAHEVRPAIADVTLEAASLNWEIELTLEGILSGVDMSAVADTNLSPRASEYDRLRIAPPGELEDLLRRSWPTLRSGFVIRAGDTVVFPDLELVLVPDVGNPDLPRDSRLTLTAELPEDGSAVEIGWRGMFGPMILRHSNGGEEAFAGLLSGGTLTPPLPREGGAAESALQSFGRYIVLGIEHIVPKGLDHILFVLGLFFYSIRMKPLFYQVTAFTAAHTVTLAMASLGIVRIAPEIVEPLIAASIVYVAFENLRPEGNTGVRTAVVFLFGLLHGLGFASVLGDIGLAEGRFIATLIGFNIGVEIGQMLVILVAWLVIGHWFGTKAFYRPWIAQPASIAIGLIGAWWVVERTILA